jgi:amino acid transporter
MDKLAELSHGAKVVLGAAIALLIFSFFDWFEYADIGFANMWNGIGVLAGLLLIALIVWQALRLANINLEVGVTPSMITAALSVLLVIFVAIRFLDKPGPSIANAGVDRTIWAWLGLILAIVIVVGAWMNMRAAGEGLGDVRDRVTSMTSGGGASSAPAAEAPPAPAPTAADEAVGTEEPPKPA